MISEHKDIDELDKKIPNHFYHNNEAEENVPESHLS